MIPPAIHLMLFTRAPVLGQSKTRLAREVGAASALEFHLACLQDLIGECNEFAESSADLTVERHLFLTPAGGLAALLGAGIRELENFTVHDQAGADLGARMAHAFRAVLGEPGRADRSGIGLLFGSDLPLLTQQHFRESLRALRQADAVFCPTHDGGYCLVGLKAIHDDLFQLRAWSHGEVLEETMQAARRSGLSTGMLAALPDVDCLGDLSHVRRHPSYKRLAQRRSIKWIDALEVGADEDGVDG